MSGSELCIADPRPDGCLRQAVPGRRFCRYCLALVEDRPATRRRTDPRILRRWRRIGRRIAAQPPVSPPQGDERG